MVYYACPKPGKLFTKKSIIIVFKIVCNRLVILPLKQYEINFFTVKISYTLPFLNVFSGCKNKKVKSSDTGYICPACKDKVSPNKWGNAVLSLLIEGKDMIQPTIWRPHLMQMFPRLTAESFNSMSSDDLEDYIAQSMAINTTGHITFFPSESGIKVLYINMKRKRSTGTADADDSE